MRLGPVRRGRGGRRSRSLVGLLLAGALAAGSLAACGSTGAPSGVRAGVWHLPAGLDRRSGADFCAELRIDLHHLRAGADLDSTSALHADVDGFLAAFDRLSSVAPPALAGEVATFAASTDTLVAALAAGGRRRLAPAALRRLASPTTARAERAVLDYAARSCHPDPLGARAPTRPQGRTPAGG